MGGDQVRLTQWLTGRRTVSVAAVDAARLLELLRRTGLLYTDFRTSPDGRLSVVTSRRSARRTEALAPSFGITTLTVTSCGGLPDLLDRARRRPGLWVGGLLGLCLLWLSGQYLWDVRVSGNERLTARDVCEDLEACGLTVGSSLRGFKADVLENQVLLHDKRLSWISVNRQGTVAYVQVREAAYPEPKPDEGPANLVAARGGCIERIELTDGNLLVRAGQEVREGQLLVSGLYDGPASEDFPSGVRTTHASARVFAKTARTFLIEIPLSYEETRGSVVPTEDGRAPTSEISVIFFGKVIKFSKKTGNAEGFCDTIESEINCSPAEGVGLPLSIRRTWYLPVEKRRVTRTPAEAEALAYLALSREIAAIPGGAELISEQILPTLTDTCFRLEVHILCVEDIAREAPVGIG